MDDEIQRLERAWEAGPEPEVAERLARLYRRLDEGRRARFWAARAASQDPEIAGDLLTETGVGRLLSWREAPYSLLFKKRSEARLWAASEDEVFEQARIALPKELEGEPWLCSSGRGIAGIAKGGALCLWSNKGEDVVRIETPRGGKPACWSPTPHGGLVAGGRAGRSAWLGLKSSPSEGWRALEVGQELKDGGKGFDFLAWSGSTLIAVDDFLIPIYLGVYDFGDGEAPRLRRTVTLPNHHTYERIEGAAAAGSVLALCSSGVGRGGPGCFLSLYSLPEVRAGLSFSDWSRERVRLRAFDLNENHLAIGGAYGLVILDLAAADPLAEQTQLSLDGALLDSPPGGVSVHPIGLEPGESVVAVKLFGERACLCLCRRQEGEPRAVVTTY